MINEKYWNDPSKNDIPVLKEKNHKKNGRGWLGTPMPTYSLLVENKERQMQLV